MKNINLEQLALNIVDFKKKCYASGINPTLSFGDNLRIWRSRNGHYSYKDEVVGKESFSGTEIIYYNDNPIWFMNRYTKINLEKIRHSYPDIADLQGFPKTSRILEMEREVLSKGFIDHSLRGPSNYNGKDFMYINSLIGDFNISSFIGHDRILLTDKRFIEKKGVHSLELLSSVYMGGLLR